MASKMAGWNGMCTHQSTISAKYPLTRSTLVGQGPFEASRALKELGLVNVR